MIRIIRQQPAKQSKAFKHLYNLQASINPPTLQTNLLSTCNSPLSLLPLRLPPEPSLLLSTLVKPISGQLTASAESALLMAQAVLTLSALTSRMVLPYQNAPSSTLFPTLLTPHGPRFRAALPLVSYKSAGDLTLKHSPSPSPPWLSMTPRTTRTPSSAFQTRMLLPALATSVHRQSNRP